MVNLFKFFSFIFFTLGFWITSLNWYGIFSDIIKKKHYSSIPFLGGMFFTLGFFLWFKKFSLLYLYSFFLDYGSSWLFIYLFFFLLFHKLKKSINT